MTEDSKQSIQPNVFVVDDDMIVRGAARVSLEEAGFMVSEAENGVQALEAVEHLKPDIILLDVMMPEMDGFDTCSDLRKLPGHELVPILIMSKPGKGSTFTIYFPTSETTQAINNE